MAKEFKLTGEPEEKFAQLEMIIPRLLRKGNTSKRVKHIPPSIVSCQAGDLSVPLKCLLFEGKINKLSYSVGSATKNGKQVELDLSCSLVRSNETRLINIKSKKHKNVIDLDINTIDGDELVITSNDPETQYSTLLISIMITHKFSTVETINLSGS